MTTNNGAGGLVAKWRAEADALRDEAMIGVLTACASELEAALQAPGEAVAWTDDQCTEFACVAFRHAPKNLPEGVTLQDIRLGAARVIRMAATPPSDVLRRVVEALEATAKCLSGLQSQFDHAGCTCTFPDDNCCSYSRADTVLTKARAALAAHKALAEGVDRG